MAGAKNNGDFICIETWSGYRSSNLDPKGKQHLLSPDVSDEALGVAVLDALAFSRFVLPAPRTDVWQHPDAEFDKELYDYKLGIERHAKWIADLMSHFGYKTKRALFKNMHSCDIERKEGSITIGPTHHEKLEAWSREKDNGIEDVVIPADSTPSEIGAALRLAFSRCTG